MLSVNGVKRFPKIELHCHLDGSVMHSAVKRIMKGEGDLDQMADKMKVPKKVSDLRTYLACFDYTLPFLQSRENLEIAAYELIREAADENTIYIEVRFAPQFHCREGLSQSEACGAVLKGLELGERDFGVKSRAILCMMRGASEENNLKTVECAKELLHCGAAGLDLAGDEKSYPPGLYKNIFDKAGNLGIPFTVHAGECGSAQNVKTAIEMGACRIGHGVAIAGNPEIKQMCIKNNIALEMCPVSNLQTKAVDSIENYPFVEMACENVPVTINTDNRMVSDTCLTKEWELLGGSFQEIDERIMEEAGRTAVEAVFLPSVQKRKLAEEYERKVNLFKKLEQSV